MRSRKLATFSVLAVGFALVLASSCGDTKTKTVTNEVCPASQVKCNDICIDPNTDRAYCGASGDCQGANAGTVCADGEVCNGAGVCALSCQAGLIDCDGKCVDTNSDPDNCGACGRACSGFAGCLNRVCADFDHYFFSGPMLNVPISDLVGWELCYIDTYATDNIPFDPILVGCSKENLLLGCRTSGSDELLAAAHASRADVLFDTGVGDTPHNANGVGWYFNKNYSWGFANEGDPINRGSCDTENTNPDYRLCWHAGTEELKDGYRCGAAINLNSSTAYERLIFHAGPEVAEHIYLTSSNGSIGFYRYSITLDTWTTLTSPPVVTSSQLANDGVRVYLMGQNNTVYAYDPKSDTWSAVMAGPGALTNTPIGFFQWFEDGFYYLQDGQSTMYVYRDGAWSNFDIGGSGSCAGTWDQENDELYIRTYQQLGFRVIDTSGPNTVVRTITDATNVGENSRTGSYSNGYFYSRTNNGSLQQFNGVTGALVDTAQTPTSDHTATDTDHSTGIIYISGYGGVDGDIFQSYDPESDTITDLANQPMVDNHSTITVMRTPLP